MDSTHLKGYIFKNPYLDYERLKQHLKTSSDQALIRFIKQNQQSWLAEDLTTDLLGRFAKQGQWRSVLAFYKEGQGGIKAKCYGLEAKIRTSHNAKKALNDAMKLWLSANRRPNNCNPLFSLMRQKGLLNDKKVWQRITLAMNKGHSRLARDLAKYTKNPSLVSLWVKLRKKPKKHLNNKQLKQNTPRNRQLIAYAVKRIARKNTQKARNAWHKAQRTHHFTSVEKSDVESYIGIRDALNHSPYALQKLAAIPAKFRSDDATIWLARMALRQGDWKKLLNAIGSMKPDVKKEDIWQYWKAYAEKRLGRKPSINLSKLAKNASFYGFLAADQLHKPYVRLLQKERNWNRLIPKIKARKSMQRATELFRIGKPKLAKKRMVSGH